MNMTELDHALRKLRLSGMADTLELRLLEAQSEKMVPIDLVAALVSDEIVRREDRLLGRRIKKARFRGGVLSLVKQQGATAVEPACTMALEMQQPTYQFVRRYLERQPTLPLSLKQVDPLIRELTHYRDLIDRRLEGEVHEPD